MAFDPAYSALSLRVFGEDITTAAREAAAKKKAKAEEDKEGGEAAAPAAIPGDTPAVLEDDDTGGEAADPQSLADEGAPTGHRRREPVDEPARVDPCAVRREGRTEHALCRDSLAGRLGVQPDRPGAPVP